MMRKKGDPCEPPSLLRATHAINRIKKRPGS
jgi:hypothetical protein